MRLQVLVGTPGTAGIVALEVEPFHLAAISGHSGDVFFAARGLDVPGTLRTVLRLANNSPDRLTFELSAASLGKLWVLARGKAPQPSGAKRRIWPQRLAPSSESCQRMARPRCSQGLRPP